MSEIIVIALGSQNPAKIKAARLAFKKVFSKKITITPFNVPSGIPPQPLSEKQAFKGALNRAKKAIIKNPRAQFAVGLEGTIQKYPLGVLEGGLAVVIDKKGKLSIGSSPRLPLPQKIIKEIKKGKELGEIIDRLANKKNTKQKQGAFGFLTNNIITRQYAYQQALICALSPWIKKELY